jgi:hypothetical protein
VNALSVEPNLSAGVYLEVVFIPAEVSHHPALALVIELSPILEENKPPETVEALLEADIE